MGTYIGQWPDGDSWCAPFKSWQRVCFKIPYNLVDRKAHRPCSPTYSTQQPISQQEKPRTSWAANIFFGPNRALLPISIALLGHALLQLLRFVPPSPGNIYGSILLTVHVRSFGLALAEISGRHCQDSLKLSIATARGVSMRYLSSQSGARLDAPVTAPPEPLDAPKHIWEESNKLSL